MSPGLLVALALVIVQVVSFGGPARSGPAFGTYQWPVRGPVIRGYEPPPDPYGAGHRGIDIAAPFGSTMVAAQDGIVGFAGWIGGSLFISLDHPDGVRTTYSWLSAIGVNKGDVVSKGRVIGATGAGHPGVTPPHLHFGARVGQTYIDPMLLLEGAGVVDFIHLAPLPGAWRQTQGDMSGHWVGSGSVGYHFDLMKWLPASPLEWPDLASPLARFRSCLSRDHGPPIV